MIYVKYRLIIFIPNFWDERSEMRINSAESDAGTVVGANVRLQGTLKDTNDIIVHGTVEGDVISDKSIMVTESAMVKGPVIGGIITIGGTVKGSIEAKDKLEILTSGKVSGSISAATLIIQAGAQFNGKCTTTSGKEIENGKTEKEVKDVNEKEIKEIEPKPEEKESTSDFELE